MLPKGVGWIVVSFKDGHFKAAEYPATHASLDRAIGEAERLAEYGKGTEFYVMRPVHRCVTKSVHSEPITDDDMPDLPF